MLVWFEILEQTRGGHPKRNVCVSGGLRVFEGQGWKNKKMAPAGRQELKDRWTGFIKDTDHQWEIYYRSYEHGNSTQQNNLSSTFLLAGAYHFASLHDVAEAQGEAGEWTVSWTVLWSSRLQGPDRTIRLVSDYFICPNSVCEISETLSLMCQSVGRATASSFCGREDILSPPAWLHNDSFQRNEDCN